MKNTFFVLSFVAALLLIGNGCNGKKKNLTVDTSTEETQQVDDKGIAFEVFQRIPKDDLDVVFREKTYTCPEECYRHFGDSEGNDANAELYLENGGNRMFTVDCFPLKGGGWLAMLVNEGCFDGCEQNVKTYVYKDGVLNFAKGMLPMPVMEEMVAYPFLLYGISDEQISDFKSEWNDRLLYAVMGDDTLCVNVETLNYEEQFMSVLSTRMYVWDGEEFVPIHNNEAHSYHLIDRDGLGGLHLDDTIPQELPGLNKRMEGELVVFSRDGEPFFKLHPDGEGKIQAIDVYAKDLVYYRGKVGDTLNRLLYKGAAENNAYFKDGNFVVSESLNDVGHGIDYVGPKDAIDGAFVEGPIENPKFKSDATVQFVRIYKLNEWENDTCDMRALREALEDAMLDQGNPIYGINHFEYYREMYNDSCQGWCDSYNYYLHCYPLKSGGFKVYETANWQPGWEEEDSESGFSKISAYVYKNGQLTEVEPEPELNDFPLKEDSYHFSTVSNIYFYDRTMTVSTGFAESGKMQGVEFTWDGTTMRKTYEGTFEN